MDIKELAIRGLLQKHGKGHLWRTCEDLMRDLVELGGGYEGSVVIEQSMMCHCHRGSYSATTRSPNAPDITVS